MKQCLNLTSCLCYNQPVGPDCSAVPPELGSAAVAAGTGTTEEGQGVAQGTGMLTGTGIADMGTEIDLEEGETFWHCHVDTLLPSGVQM